jgi:hypothetical protein
MSGDIENGPFWLDQYGFVLNALQQEGNKYWTRFQSSLIVNGGLLAFFYTILFPLLDSEKHPIVSPNHSLWIFPLHNWILIIIIGLGLFLSAIWLKLTLNGSHWQDFWGDLGRELENKHSKHLEVFIFEKLKNYEGAYSIIKLSLCIPISFIISWTLFLALFLYSISAIPVP